MTLRLAAVDLGATSGRVMVVEVGPDDLGLTEVHRFPNGAARAADGSLRWDVRRLYDEVRAGLAHAGRIDGVGIDAWAIDYGLLDDAGELVEAPYCYRDGRTDGVAARVREQVGAAELYRRTGVQQLPFNTIYQLVAAADSPAIDRARTMLLVPDLLGYWLTGVPGAERTNASTTGLYDVRAQAWDTDLAARVGIDPGLLPPLRSPGEVLGPAVGLDVPVVAVGSHDTASAVVSVPFADPSAAYISSGTWSLVGLELDAPVLSEAARLADFTNEAGVDGATRFLKNVMGLWVLSQSVDAWGTELTTVLTAAAACEPLRTVVDIDDASLLPPGDMPARIAALARSAGEPVPSTPAEVTRCILDSLALAYRRTVRRAGALAGREPRVVHVVGGGSRNELLCQLSADALGLPVLAGPAEAAAIGNGLVQARALLHLQGSVDLPDLAAMRALVRRTHPPRRYEPRPGADWDAAEQRLDRVRAEA
ncbi:rhamnulokinase family protein [Nocardioides sp.]|uniref:rhamnulokinase n=1 Tax=Nocardioides sp. TaxID=35761 RepID=UPI002ED9AC6B